MVVASGHPVRAISQYQKIVDVNIRYQKKAWTRAPAHRRHAAASARPAAFAQGAGSVDGGQPKLVRVSAASGPRHPCGASRQAGIFAKEVAWNSSDRGGMRETPGISLHPGYNCS